MSWKCYINAEIEYPVTGAKVVLKHEFEYTWQQKPCGMAASFIWNNCASMWIGRPIHVYYGNHIEAQIVVDASGGHKVIAYHEGS